MKNIGFLILLPVLGCMATDGSGCARAGELDPRRFELLSTTSEEVQGFLDAMKNAVEAANSADFSKLVEFPLRVGLCGSERVVEGAEELGLIYSELIDRDLQAAIMGQSVHNLAVSWRGMMIASGRLWFTVVCDKESKVGECANQRVRVFRINYNCTARDALPA